MKDRTESTLPRLTADQLRQLVAAEKKGVRPPCFLCGEPVLDQKFLLSAEDQNDRLIVNSPCLHTMTYGVQLAVQVEAQMRAQAATEATEPGTSRAAGGPQPLDGNAAADALAAEMHRRATRFRELRDDPNASASAREQVYGEALGLRGAIGIVLGHQVPGGSADLYGIDYYEAWCSRQGVRV